MRAFRSSIFCVAWMRESDRLMTYLNHSWLFTPSRAPSRSGISTSRMFARSGLSSRNSFIAASALKLGSVTSRYAGRISFCARENGMSRLASSSWLEISWSSSGTALGSKPTAPPMRLIACVRKLPSPCVALSMARPSLASRHLPHGLTGDTRHRPDSPTTNSRSGSSTCGGTRSKS